MKKIMMIGAWVTMSLVQEVFAEQSQELVYEGLRPWEYEELKKLPKPDRSVVYKTVDIPGTSKKINLRLYMFTPKNHKPGDKSPAIIFFSGGGGLNGWGHLAQFYAQCYYLASRGMVAICADRRNGNRTGLSTEIEKKYKEAFLEEDMINDAKSAFRFIRKHAGEFGIDPDKVVGGCSSYGGFVLSNTCIPNKINEKDEDNSIDCKPLAMVMFCPVLDRSPDGYHNNTVKDWRKVSPLHRLNKDFPPTLILVGDRDTVLPVATAALYQQAMKAMGIRCDLHIYADTPHGLNKPRFYETMVEVDKFLTSLGFLKGKHTLPKTKGELVLPVSQKSK